jgi:hypothetical protein
MLCWVVLYWTGLTVSSNIYTYNNRFTINKILQEKQNRTIGICDQHSQGNKQQAQGGPPRRHTADAGAKQAGERR